MKKVLLKVIWGLVAVVALYFAYITAVPFLRWLLVDTTVTLYEQTTDRFDQGKDVPSYKGIITDTIIQRSNKKGEKDDTLVHRQQIDISQTSNEKGHKPTYGDLGAFSDSAGLLGAFFSLVAFLAVVATLVYQWRKDANDKKYAAKLQFEQEFFSMTAMLEDIVSHLRFSDSQNATVSSIADKMLESYYKSIGDWHPDKNEDREEKPKTVEGRDVFKYIYEDRENYNLLSYINREELLQLTSEAQDMCFDGTLDHYFRYLYRILKHIDESDLLNKLENPKKEREYYAHVLRAQLSNYELLMLFYNGLIGENPQTIKKLIEKYAMFNNLRAWELGNHQSGYYQAIMDAERLEDPENFDPQTTYSVTAFWDEKKLRELKKEGKKGQSNLSLCAKCYGKMKSLASQRIKKMKIWCEEESLNKRRTTYVEPQNGDSDIIGAGTKGKSDRPVKNAKEEMAKKANLSQRGQEWHPTNLEDVRRINKKKGKS